MHQIENIIEDLIEQGLPEKLAGKIEQLIVNERARADDFEKKYEDLRTEVNWERNPDRMGW